jgi:Ca2+-binding EF-hand superfamily protein
MLRSFQLPSFSSLDGNGNGGISLDELKSAGPGKAGGAKSDERVQKLFEAMDTDGSGEVSSAEKDSFDSKMAEARQAMQFMAQQFAGKPPSNDDIFAATDKDSSGGISIEEFSSSDAAEGMSTEDLQKLFSVIDGDGSGAISEDESSAFLDGLKEAAGGPPPMGGPGGPKGPPPGGPPLGGSSSEEEEEDSTNSIALNLLSAATQAYGSTSKSKDLLSVLSSVFDEAA